MIGSIPQSPDGNSILVQGIMTFCRKQCKVRRLNTPGGQTWLQQQNIVDIELAQLAVQPRQKVASSKLHKECAMYLEHGHKSRVLEEASGLRVHGNPPQELGVEQAPHPRRPCPPLLELLRLLQTRDEGCIPWLHFKACMRDEP